MVGALEPLISVVLPVRRWHAYLEPALASLLGQTHRNLEILLVGHDNVQELARRLPTDLRVRPLARSAPGITGALNTGLAAAQGDYIARMDDDDLCLPERLACQLRWLSGHPDIGLCATRVALFDEHEPLGAGHSSYMRWLNSLTTPAAIAADCLIECPMPHPSLMAHRTIWQQLGPYRDFDGPEDYDLVLRAWLAGIGMGKPESILLRWRQHPERLTWHDPRYRREAFIELKARTVAAPASGLGLAEGRAVWLCGTGRSARRWCDALVAAGVRVLGFVDLERPGARRQKRHRPVIVYAQLWRESREHLIISALGQPAAREQLRHWLTQRAYQPGVDYLLGA